MMSAKNIMLLLVLSVGTWACIETDQDKKDPDQEPQVTHEEDQAVDPAEPKQVSLPEPDIVDFGPELKGPDRAVKLMNHYMVVYDSAVGRKRHILLDRFGSRWAGKVALVRREEVLDTGNLLIYPQAHFWYFEYQDTAQLQNVVRNWFLEFGDSRKEIIVGQDEGEIASAPMKAMISEKSIAILQTDCQLYNTFGWDTLYRSFENTFRYDMELGFSVDCKGRLTWMN